MLNPPPRQDVFNQSTLPTVSVDPASLYRIGKYNTGEPFFGTSGGNRFDDPEKVASKRYGASYFGFSLACALAETVLHNLVPVRGRFPVTASEIDSRYVLEFTGTPLVLADYTGAALKRSGATSELSTITPYTLPQKWSRAVHRHPAQVDGIKYVSNHLNTEFAVVLFDRASKKVSLRQATPLPAYPGALAAAMLFRLDIS